jgi:DNA repair exonuclease SbcCD ATPase subunit
VKNVTFKKVCIKNFLSIGKTPLSIEFNKGITVITGENKDKGGKNGIGKSTIADAIFWCLFGNTIRELKKDKIQHNKNKEICEVWLQFSVQDTSGTKDYTVIRQLDPAKIQIFCKADDITLSTLPKNDEFIKELIGANEEVFNNTVVMSANNTIPFMAQKKTEKRKFIEGILQLNIFGEMLLSVRGEYNDEKKSNDLHANNFINEQRILDLLKNNKETFAENKTSRIKSITDKIDLNNKELDILREKEITSVDDSKKELEDLKTKQNKLEELQKEVNREISELTGKKTEANLILEQKKRELNKISEKGITCPTCNRKYSSDDIDHVKNEINNIKTEIKKQDGVHYDIVEKIKEKNKLISKICENKAKIQKMVDESNFSIREASLHEQKMLNLINKNIEHEKDIKDIENESFKDDNKITDCEKKIKDIENTLSNIKKHLAVLDTVKFIVSEEGVKTYIVKKIINILNTRLNYYLQALDAPCKCVFDEMFEETIYNDQGKECSYFNFSGGERKRIDTAILFTFQDVMRCHSGTSFSLNIYDELFDCALDVKGTDKILEILKEKVNKYDESIYIVSHKSSEIVNCDNVIFLEKSNGITKIAS